MIRNFKQLLNSKEFLQKGNSFKIPSCFAFVEELCTPAEWMAFHNHVQYEQEHPRATWRKP